MRPRPRAEAPDYKGSGKLHGKVALITGGDSGIGRAVAVAFAREGANVAFVYLDEHHWIIPQQKPPSWRSRDRLLSAWRSAACASMPSRRGRSGPH